MGVERDKIIHNPWVEGSPAEFGSDPDPDPETGEAEGWTEEADNDYSVTRAAMQNGWVRGGHEVDVYAYWKQHRIIHHGGIFLEGLRLVDLHATATADMEKWPRILSTKVHVASSQKT